jgi:hypothetical protein
MKKFFRGFRKASDLRERAANAKIRAEQLQRIRNLIEGGGGAQDEREVIETIRAWKPGIKDQETQALLKQFRIAVSGDPEHDQEPY